MDRQDWVLVTLHFGEARGLSPVQLQKSLFLLRMEVPEARANLYDFFPHNYGPFSKQIYADAEHLAGAGLIAIEKIPQSHSTFLITAAGEQRALGLRPEVPARAWDYLRTVVQWTQQQTFSGLIRAIYAKYPEYRVNSVFQY